MKADINRATRETSIELSLTTTSPDRAIDIPARFLGHMLDAFATHGRFGLTLRAAGDTDVDQHHLVEDLGIALGKAVRTLVADGAGIQRAGFWRMPMDESLADAAIDLCGRSTLELNLPLKDRFVGDLDSEALREFFLGFTREAACALHLDLIRSRNDHHAVEAIFKAFGRALRMALEPVDTPGPISSKGSL
ncbi:MAG: imidazoleglycerol-phosphate dehydratase [Phycisphaeraceae bacterium]|nr:MAG: imidazoleglycerol-phosphate dehydratase [Phycisphaeraceae bacterium]